MTKAPRDARKVGGQALRDAVDEILLLRVAADIGEGQDDDREARRTLPVGAQRMRAAGAASSRAALDDAIGPHRPRDVLEALLADIDEIRVDLAAHILVGELGNQTPPGSQIPSSRAAMLTPSPRISSPSTSTSPRLTPMR